MKQLMLVFAISILSIAILACGPAVGRAVGDAQVDVDATLAEMGEPTTEAEKELHAMIKEIDRLHQEEREDLLTALSESGNIVDNLVGVIDSLGNELDEETLVKIGSVIATGQDVDAFFQGVREQAYQNKAKEKEINDLLQNEERATWDRIKFLNEQLDKANAEKAEIKKDLDKAHVNLDIADKDEDKWISANLDKENDIQVLEARMERASGKFEVVTAMLDQVLGDEDEDIAHAPTAFEKSTEEAGRYQAAAIFHECLVEWGVEVKETTREEMKHCRQGVIDEMDSLSTETVEIVNGEVIAKPNYVAMLDLDDVKDVVDTFMHCAYTEKAERVIGPAAEKCRMAAKDIPHDAAGNGSTFTDHFANKIAGDSADARRTRKFIDVKADAIGDQEFRQKLDKVMYQPGRSKDEVRDAFRGLLNEAKEDLDCDPQGLSAKPCNDFEFNHRDYDDDGRMPVAHKFQGHMENRASGGFGTSGMGGGQGYDQPGSGHHKGIDTDITKEQFDKFFTGGHDEDMRGHVTERVAQCESAGNTKVECLNDVRDDMRNSREGHRNFNEDEFHKQREQMTQHHSQNFQNFHGGGQQRMPNQPGMGNMPHAPQNHFGGRGDGAGKRGHHQMMECIENAAGSQGAGAQFNNAGDYAGGPSFGDAADNCMEHASNMMEGSFGNRDMGQYSGMVGTHGSNAMHGFNGMQGTPGGSQQ